MLPLPPPPPANMGFVMPMFKPWVPRAIQPWIFVVCVFCIQFSNGMYLGALDDIQGSTNFMIEDLLMCLYANLAGMAVYFPLLFRMKFRFTNQQLVIGAAIVIAVCNLLTMRCQFQPALWIICFISGMAKLQGTFEHMSNIQLWITPKRDFAVFFPVLHIILLTAIEGSGFMAAWFGYHLTWEMTHIFIVGLMCIVIAVQMFLCQPFCPMPQRLSLKGIDFIDGVLISILMLSVSYILLYGDYLMWWDNRNIRIITGVSLVLLSLILHRLTHVSNPYVDLAIFRQRNVIAILIVVSIAEILLGCEHTMEEILYEEVIDLQEHTKESQFLWALPGIYAGVLIDLFWLKIMKWKVWKLFGIGFACILAYALLMYFTLDLNVNIEQFRLPIMLRGCAYAILAATLMWALDESLHDLEQFFMGLFVFNILHMYLAGAVAYAFYTTHFMHLLNDDMARYGMQLTLTHLDMAHFNFSDFMQQHYLHSMMNVAIKQVFGIVIWVSLFFTSAFFLLDIPKVRNGFRKIPYWPVFGIEMLSRLRR